MMISNEIRDICFSWLQQTLNCSIHQNIKGCHTKMSDCLLWCWLWSSYIHEIQWAAGTISTMWRICKLIDTVLIVFIWIKWRCEILPLHNCGFTFEIKWLSFLKPKVKTEDPGMRYDLNLPPWKSKQIWVSTAVARHNFLDQKIGTSRNIVIL